MVEKTLYSNIISPPYSKELFNAISHDTGEDVASFISENIALEQDKSILYYPTKGIFKQNVDYTNIRSILDLRRVNYARDINTHFISINKLLPDGGIYVGCFESYINRKIKIINRLGKFFVGIIWTLDFIFNRIIPKVEITKWLYKLLTHNRYSVISLAETLGRTVYCGFEIIDYKIFNNLTYFSVIKTSEPRNDKDPSFGPLFKMRRVGKGGNIIGVYKLRTMHPYSEYLQNYIIKLNGYNEYGKVKNDFRITGWSKIVRKLYLDEVPQLINVIKGEMNLVGVRPLSLVSYNLLPEELKRERIKYKPGCIPPYIALKKKGLDGVLESERIYLREMEISAIRTNFKYFFLAIFNLLTFSISSN